MAKPVPRLSPEQIQEVIAVAWDDRPPFAAVLQSHGLSPGQVVQLLKRELTPSAYKTWVARTKAPHRGLAAFQIHDEAHTHPGGQSQLRLRERALLACGANRHAELL